MLRNILSMVVCKFLHFRRSFQTRSQPHFVQHKAIVSVAFAFIEPKLFLIIENIILLCFPWHFEAFLELFVFQHGQFLRRRELMHFVHVFIEDGLVLIVIIFTFDCAKTRWQSFQELLVPVTSGVILLHAHQFRLLLQFVEVVGT